VNNKADAYAARNEPSPADEKLYVNWKWKGERGGGLLSVSFILTVFIFLVNESSGSLTS